MGLIVDVMHIEVDGGDGGAAPPLAGIPDRLVAELGGGAGGLTAGLLATLDADGVFYLRTNSRGKAELKILNEEVDVPV